MNRHCNKGMGDYEGKTEWILIYYTTSPNSGLRVQAKMVYLNGCWQMTNERRQMDGNKVCWTKKESVGLEYESK